jgi:hypothetical protein
MRRAVSRRPHHRAIQVAFRVARMARVCVVQRMRRFAWPLSLAACVALMEARRPVAATSGASIRARSTFWQAAATQSRDRFPSDHRARTAEAGVAALRPAAHPTQAGRQTLWLEISAQPHEARTDVQARHVADASRQLRVAIAYTGSTAHSSQCLHSTRRHQRRTKQQRGLSKLADR